MSIRSDVAHNFQKGDCVYLCVPDIVSPAAGLGEKVEAGTCNWKFAAAAVTVTAVLKHSATEPRGNSKGTWDFSSKPESAALGAVALESLDILTWAQRLK